MKEFFKKAKQAFDFKVSAQSFTPEQLADINQKTAQLEKAFTENNLQEALDLINIVSNNYFYQKDSIVAKYSKTYKTFADLQKAVAALPKPVKKWPWEKEELKQLPITPEEKGLENFEITYAYSTGTEKLTHEDGIGGPREIQDAKFEDTANGIFVIADGVSSASKDVESRASGKFAKWTATKLGERIKDLKTTAKSAEELERLIKEEIEKLKAEVPSWLADTTNNPRGETNVSTTINTIVEFEGKLVVVTLGDSLVYKVSKNDSGGKQIELINEPALVFGDRDERKLANNIALKIVYKLARQSDGTLEKDADGNTQYQFGITPEDFEDQLSTAEKKYLDDNFSDKATNYLEKASQINTSEIRPEQVFPNQNKDWIYSTVITPKLEDIYISMTDGGEFIGLGNVQESINATNPAEALKIRALNSKYDDFVCQLLEIKAKTPPVASSSPDTLDPVEQAIIVEIHNCEFTLDGGVKAQPDPEQAKEIYLKVKGKSNFINADGSINLVNLKKSYSAYSRQTLLDNFNHIEGWNPDNLDYLK